jgi:hypothetical protein
MMAYPRSCWHISTYDEQVGQNWRYDTMFPASYHQKSVGLNGRKWKSATITRKHQKRHPKTIKKHDTISGICQASVGISEELLSYRHLCHHKPRFAVISQELLAYTQI